MRVQQYILHRSFALMLGLSLMLIGVVTAQDDVPAPQFLYRDDNRLVLLNAYTGEATELPFDVTKQDRFTWSPDGHYLLTQLQDHDTMSYCLNLYDVDAQEWLYEEPFICGVQDTIFSSDSSQIFYTSVENYNQILWLHNLTDGTSQELYRTTGGGENFESGISDIEWSPTERYLTFINYNWIRAGTLNFLVVLNPENQSSFGLSGGSSYNAHYDPIWSENDDWFLIQLKDEYAAGSMLLYTNHQGDVYLFNAETGEQYRITYTPATAEIDIHWTEDGEIAFTEVIYQDWTITLEEAMDVEVVPREDIVTPEPVDEPEPVGSAVMISPDLIIGAWVSSTATEEQGRIYELNIGEYDLRDVHFSFQISDSYKDGNIFIGWRPSDYPYPFD